MLSVPQQGLLSCGPARSGSLVWRSSHAMLNDGIRFFNLPLSWEQWALVSVPLWDFLGNVFLGLQQEEISTHRSAVSDISGNRTRGHLGPEFLTTSWSLDVYVERPKPSQLTTVEQSICFYDSSICHRPAPRCCLAAWPVSVRVPSVWKDVQPNVHTWAKTLSGVWWFMSNHPCNTT